MTRKQAELYCRIPKSDIGGINRGYEKNYDAMRAYAFGADLQSRSRFNPRAHWENITEPSFEECFEYRVAEDGTFPVFKLERGLVDGRTMTDGEIALIRAVRNLEFLAVFDGNLDVIIWGEDYTKPVLAAIGITSNLNADKALVDALKQIKEEKEMF